MQLVSYFKNEGSFEEFCQSQSLDQESEVIEIYMKKLLKLYGNITFFAIENTEGRVEYTHENVEYSNLFDFYYFLDVIEDSNSNKSLTNEGIARILYDYAINDA